ncbi:hypothetical protein KM176_21985 [Pseudooceanicola sp. CBS1P-1]|uniref:DUF1232 domain-containing protein n=1 Tax=Pseudooceanicola albus TaxID=2692189 RepID=A0A6L7G9D2_9RHOB|nr:MULTISPECIES: hypothetical protein [Pseudooceanicola]MBT9386546.1 hypothetical protein [Pseudooceanicola endophyticus]MXN20579.1 hypothetical protein [Pseudooceanicola albus]
MSLVLARILLRYLAGAMVSYGLLAPEVGSSLAQDPDLIVLAGAVLASATEGLYAFARRAGWAT